MALTGAPSSARLGATTTFSLLHLSPALQFHEFLDMLSADPAVGRTACCSSVLQFVLGVEGGGFEQPHALIQSLQHELLDRAVVGCALPLP